ncbi:MAG TPA: hypothetical protein VHN80_05085 [Kineosporiaceae bacterium]|nr:hypothetical protein [Kineosporiaceae bacterium]
MLVARIRIWALRVRRTATSAAVAAAGLAVRSGGAAGCASGRACRIPPGATPPV